MYWRGSLQIEHVGGGVSLCPNWVPHVTQIQCSICAPLFSRDGPCTHPASRASPPMHNYAHWAGWVLSLTHLKREIFEVGTSFQRVRIYLFLPVEPVFLVTRY
jgi:hypothetical protein